MSMTNESSTCIRKPDGACCGSVLNVASTRYALSILFSDRGSHKSSSHFGTRLYGLRTISEKVKKQQNV